MTDDAFIYGSRPHPARARLRRTARSTRSTALNLATQALASLRARNKLDPALVDDVVLGCVDLVGEGGRRYCPRRRAAPAGYGNGVPGVQINRFCASGLDAVNFAAAEVMAGQHDMTVGGGVESMSRVGIGTSGGAWPVDPSIAIPSYFMPQGVSADLIATKYGFSRDDVDAYAVESQKRAGAAWDEGRFAKSVIPVRDCNGITLLAKDEHMRPSTTMQGLAAAAALVRADGPARGLRRRRGASASRRRGGQSRASRGKFVRYRRRRERGADRQCRGGEVALDLKPAGAHRGLRQHRLGAGDHADRADRRDAQGAQEGRHGCLSDIDLIEVNEAFAAVVLRFLQAFDVAAAKVNVNGGAIALGHPLGATGAMILGTAIDEMERRDLNTALVTLCIGAGMGTATIIERVYEQRGAGAEHVLDPHEKHSTP